MTTATSLESYGNYFFQVKSTIKKLILNFQRLAIKALPELDDVDILGQLVFF